MKILLDMNLPAPWTDFLTIAGWETVHCSTMMETLKTDQQLMDWARSNGCVVFTHGMDFGTALKYCAFSGPSVFQINAKDIMVPELGGTVAGILRQFESELQTGAIIQIDTETGRAKVFKITAQDNEGSAVR
jgi:predicted nuclease of predicted toxin-antitoxin system